MVKILLTISILFLSILFIAYIGIFLDITKEPIKKADIIISLGGDHGCRLQKAVKLYQKGFSNSNKLIYTGSDHLPKSFFSAQSRLQFLKKLGINQKNIIHFSNTTNTMEELWSIKEYMLTHGYKHAIIVSHPFHARRIKILATIIAKYSAANLHIIIAPCKTKWWNKYNIFTSKKSIIASVSELGKIIYNLIKYTIIIHH